MKKLLIMAAAVLAFACASNNAKKAADDGKLPALKVSPNGRYLMTENGDPFFWLGDTGWLIFKNLNRDDAEVYLQDRKDKGFNVVQAMVLHTVGITDTYGDSALINMNVATPRITEGNDPADSVQYDYWDHMDYIIDLAEKKGIYMALVPVWGSNVGHGHVTQQQAEVYGKWIAERYKDKSNIIWLNGGDINGGDSTAVWDVLGNAIRSVDTVHLMTYHPRGRTSSTMWFHDRPWLDFNMFQSGHRTYEQGTSGPGQKEYAEDNWKYVMEDYAMTPAKPTIDGEPSYENIPHGLKRDTLTPRWKASDIRRYGYWSVFAGAMGYTYGENSIMQMLTPNDPSANYAAKIHWKTAKDAEGAGQVQYLKDLMLSRPYFDRVPDQTLVAGENGEKYDYIVATRGNDYAMLYTYNGRPFSVNMGKIEGKDVKASWFNPRDGKYTEIGVFPNTGVAEFTPEGGKVDGNDWVLVLDSVK